MKSDLFHRYVWLVDLIRRAGKVSFEEVARHWQQSELNVDKSPLVLRTFHNHREAIGHLFGLRIACDRNDGNKYYLYSEDNLDSVDLKCWMLQTLAVSRTMSTDSTSNLIGDRLQIDNVPEEKFVLSMLIEAMKANEVLDLKYRVVGREEPLHIRLAPYCARLAYHRWFVFGLDMETNEVVSLQIENIRTVALTGEHFLLPADFSPRDFMHRYFGGEIDESLPVERIVVKFSGTALRYVRDSKLHVSQREIETSPDDSWGLFEYTLVPTYDFLRRVLWFGSDAEVLSPAVVRGKIAAGVRRIAEIYRIV